VHRLERDGSEDEQVDGALNEIGRFAHANSWKLFL
jgi:hypothetical protein